jgi:small subunit ribosomal protein S6
METRNYETVFIANPHTPDAKVQELNAKNQQIIESYSGKVLNLDDWGKKKMAYHIQKEPKGHYFCLTYTANTKAVAELERAMRINEDVFRFLTVKIDEKVDPMAAIEAYKRKLEAHAKREKERAERDAERNADRANMRGGDRGFDRGGDRGFDRGDRGDRGGGGGFRGPRSGGPEFPAAEEIIADIPELNDEE